MGLLKRVFAGPDMAKEAMEGVKKGLDAVWFTNEERAKVDEGVRAFFLEYLKTTQPQNLARRYIAFGIVGLWMLLVLLAVATHWVSETYSQFVFSVIDEHVNYPFLGIMAFYFATHMLRTHQKNGEK